MPASDQYVLSRTREARGGSFAESADGLLFLANGTDPVRVWSGVGAMAAAGTDRPASALAATASVRIGDYVYARDELNYNTGTATYAHGDTSVTIAGGTFPSWVAAGMLVVVNGACGVVTVVDSGTKVTVAEYTGVGNGSGSASLVGGFTGGTYTDPADFTNKPYVVFRRPRGGVTFDTSGAQPVAVISGTTWPDYLVEGAVFYMYPDGGAGEALAVVLERESGTRLSVAVDDDVDTGETYTYEAGYTSEDYADGGCRAYVSFVRADGRESALSPVATAAPAHPDEVFNGDGETRSAYTTAADSDLAVAGANVSYSSVPVSSDDRVVSRRIYRTTLAQSRVAYLDVQIDNNVATTASSERADAELQAQAAYPLLNADNVSTVLDRSPPPDTKPFAAWHLGRMYYGGDRPYRRGHVAVTLNSTAVTGYGTAWPTTFAGRELWVPGADSEYAVSSVADNTDGTQTMTLASQYRGATDPFSPYTVRAPLAARRLLYYSQSGRPEYVPPTQALEVPDDGDEWTGLMAMGAFLYVLKGRHVYRMTSQNDPAKDGGIYLSSHRGCVNNACWVVVGEDAVMLDGQGVHTFSGGQESRAVSGDIQDFFDGTGDTPVNWAASEFFHAVHSPAERVVRFFVCLRGDRHPAHALVYQLDNGRWSVESRPAPVGASCPGPGGRASCFLGGPSGAAYLSAGSDLDAIAAAGGGPVAVVSATPLSVTTPAATQAVAGVPVAVSRGRGRGQVRLVASASGAVLKLTRPWLVVPDHTSTLVVGGVPYRYETARFDFAGAEANAERSARVRFLPRPGQVMGFEYYRDHDADPVVPDLTLAAGGVSAAAGDPVMEIDLGKPSGSALVQFHGHREGQSDGAEGVRFALSGVAGSPPPVVTGLVLKGVV